MLGYPTIPGWECEFFNTYTVTIDIVGTVSGMIILVTMWLMEDSMLDVVWVTSLPLHCVPADCGGDEVGLPHRSGEGVGSGQGQVQV